MCVGQAKPLVGPGGPRGVVAASRNVLSIGISADATARVPPILMLSYYRSWRGQRCPGYVKPQKMGKLQASRHCVRA